MNCRSSAKTVLVDHIEATQRKRDAMKVLLRYIPWDSLSEEEESVLWEWLIKL